MEQHNYKITYWMENREIIQQFSSDKSIDIIIKDLNEKIDLCMKKNLTFKIPGNRYEILNLKYLVSAEIEEIDEIENIQKDQNNQGIINIINNA